MEKWLFRDHCFIFTFVFLKENYSLHGTVES